MKKSILFLGAVPLIIASTLLSPLRLAACTLWGAAGEITTGKGTIISKNRDWKPDHVQVLKVHRPEKGYAYFGLFVEGNDSPGIKQGVNEKGLAVITATAGSIPKATRDAQKGRSGLMSTLLAKYASCDEILADQEAVLSNRKPHFLMASDGKKILMIEVGLNGKYAVKVIESGTVVHSNHYLEDSMSEFNIKAGTSSMTRVKRIAELLESAPKPFSTETFAAFSRDQNDGPSNSIWRTGANSTESCTVASWIVETPANGVPRVRSVVANPGQPEEVHYFILDEAFWKNPPKATPFKATESEGHFAGHLQGICTNDRDAIYWSWTDNLVKTDLQGRILKQVPVANHHGDLTWHEGKVYVAVNLGKFNQPPGQEDSWVYVYDGDTLKELARHPVPELVHGAGGIAYHNGKFIVVGGLPPGTEENYLYEYDTGFKFIRRHVLPTGYTLMGIQTAAYYNGSWWFGCYGKPAVVLRTDGQFQLQGKWEFDAALGIVGIGNGKFLIGQNSGNKKTGYTGRVAVARADKTKGLVILPAK